MESDLVIMVMILILAIAANVKLVYEIFEHWRIRGLPNGQKPCYFTVCDHEMLKSLVAKHECV